MDAVEEKLRRGFTLIAQAGEDGDLLGAALLAIHAGLAEHVRVTLLAHPGLSAQERVLVSNKRGDWSALIGLMQQYAGLSHAQRQVILGAHEIRERVALGEPFRGPASSLLRYAQFVAQVCGYPELLDHQASAQFGERADGAPFSEESFTDSWESSYETVEPPPVSGIPLSRFIALLGLIVVLLLCSWGAIRPGVLGNFDVRRLLVALSMLPAPTATPGPTIAPIASPAPQHAQIVGLGDGPGWLHSAPSFESGTLPIRLSEGMPVDLLDPQQSDTNGVVWRYVRVGGYEGWCPERNLVLVAGP